MCGISGYYSPNGYFNPDHLKSMATTIVHRGPDHTGYFHHVAAGLAHNRLSIIDRSEAAHQPFISADDRYVIAYNGETYNFREIARDLGIQPKTQSDTEIVVEAFAREGVDFIHRLNGMFAMAIYDKESRELSLFRDRFGIKPLYYYWDGQQFAFASELKALLQLPIEKNIDKESLNDYLFLEYIPQPRTIFQHIYQLPNGHTLKVNDQGIELNAFYKLLDRVPELQHTTKETDALEEFNALMAQSVSHRKISDVPVGAFLSGGTDSSLICAHFQQSSDIPVKTFNIGFETAQYDESAYAAAVAKSLGTDHHHHPMKLDNLAAIEAAITTHYDQPFAVSSVLPSLQVASISKPRVTVALSGDGGDELFMGYGHYRWLDRIRRMERLGGKSGRKLAGKVLSLMSSRMQRGGQVLDFDRLNTGWPHVWSQEQYMWSEKDIAGLTGRAYRHQTTLNTWQEIDQLDITDELKVSLFDISHYLADDLLYKVDTASMAHSLEVRVPFLDHHLVEFAVGLPLDLKIRNGEQKYLLKKALEPHLPHDLIYRKKWGFGAPVDNLLRKDLQRIRTQYLSEKELDKHSLFDPKAVEKMLTSFEGGAHHHYKKIWALVVFQMWFNKHFN